MNNKPLTMKRWLACVDRYETNARETLLDLGYHPTAIEAKANKAARKGYTDYGTIPDRCWLTPKGHKTLDKLRT